MLFRSISSTYPNLNLTKAELTFPNIKTKSSAKFYYSNNPTYFVTTNGQTFLILDYTVDKKLPPDIISEYKIVNRTVKNNKSVLSYNYQSEKGVISIKIKANIGRNSRQFYPDGTGTFATVGKEYDGQLVDFLKALYKFGGQVFLNQFNYPTVAFNWFISDSNYSFDSEGLINVNIDYVYTLKKRNGN